MIKFCVARISAVLEPSTAADATTELASVHVKAALGACGSWRGGRNLCACAYTDNNPQTNELTMW